MQIHPTAIIHEGAKLGTDCKIGPYCIVGANVVLGDRVELISHVVIDGKTTIGDDSIVYPFAVLGVMSQDLKWQDESTMTGLRIGKRCKIREYVTIHSGTPASDGTVIGDDCQIMVNAHVGHDCKIGNSVVTFLKQKRLLPTQQPSFQRYIYYMWLLGLCQLKPT